MLIGTPSVVVLLVVVRGICVQTSTTSISQSSNFVPSPRRKFDGGKVSHDGDSLIGEVVRFGEYKWVVAVYHSEFEFPKCAGVILSDQSVMTSCTCVTDEEVNSYAFPDTTKTLMVIAGNPDAENPFHESRTVLKIKIHPYYDREWVGTRADLAILELNKSFQTKFYKHVAILPQYSGQPNRDAMKSELENFMNTKVVCDVMTFGFYDYEEGHEPQVRKYKFFGNHTMRVIRAIFVQPSDSCNATCPIQDRCVYDYYGREAACIAGVENDVGICGVLPGSPVYCMGNFWGIYTGPRNCSIPGAAAVPTVLSFTKFFQGFDYDESPHRPSRSHYNHPRTLVLVVLVTILIFLPKKGCIMLASK